MRSLHSGLIRPGPIAYCHTSHGSQLTSGMSALAGWKGSLYVWNNGGTGGALDLHEYAMGGDVGYYPQWVPGHKLGAAVGRDQPG